MRSQVFVHNTEFVRGTDRTCSSSPYSDLNILTGFQGHTLHQQVATNSGEEYSRELAKDVACRGILTYVVLGGAVRRIEDAVTGLHSASNRLSALPNHLREVRGLRVVGVVLGYRALHQIGLNKRKRSTQTSFIRPQLDGSCNGEVASSGSKILCGTHVGKHERSSDATGQYATYRRTGPASHRSV